MSNPTNLSELRGYICALAVTGSITPQFARCFMEMRSFNERNGLTQIEYDPGKHGLFIESARDDVVMHALDPRGDRSEAPYHWVLQIDADATFPPDTLLRLLTRAFIEAPNSGVVGAYSQLKPYPHIPTIDTGTGTWEEHYPGEGLVPVIRTGAHCFLVKTGVFNKIGAPPWFRTRPAQHPLQAMREVDNFARRKLSGKNPFRDNPEWATLMEQAQRSGRHEVGIVGEDSAFFDRCRAHNVPVYVDCDLVTGHVAQKVLQASDYIEAVRKSRKMQRQALGVTE